MLTTLRIIRPARTARARIVCPFECKSLQQRSSRIVSFSSLQRPPPPSIPPYVLGILGIPVLGGIYTYYKYLEHVPMTGRRRWIATSTEWERRLGDQEYRTLKEQFKNVERKEKIELFDHDINLLATEVRSLHAKTLN